MEFVALTFLRDRLLPEAGSDLSHESSSAVVNEALRAGILLSGRIPNPKSPRHPTSTVRLNRRHELVRRRLGRTEDEDTLFAPVRISGPALSTTVLEGRR